MSTENTPAVPEVITAFFVVVEQSGTVGVYTNEMPTVAVSREATLVDLETYASQIAREAGRIRTSQAILQALTPPPEATTSDRISEALAKRLDEE